MNIVKAWKGSNALIEKGLLLRAASSSTYAYFASSEYSRSDLRPYLTINYVCDGIYKIKNGSNYIGFENNYADTGSNVKNMTIGSSDTNDFAKEYRITYISSVDAYTIRPLASKNGYGLYLSSNGSKLILSSSAFYFKFKLNSGASNSGTYKIAASDATSKYATAGASQISMSSTSSSSQDWTLVWSDRNEAYDYYESLGFIAPFSGGQITSGYGVRNSSNHFAIDINCPSNKNSEIKSVCSGTVVLNDNDNNRYGNYIVIDTGIKNPIDSSQTLYVLYAHMKSQSSFNVGSSVAKGEIIGIVGSTGNSSGRHLHLQFYYCSSNNVTIPSNYLTYTTSIDPQSFYSFGTFTYYY